MLAVLQLFPCALRTLRGKGAALLNILEAAEFSIWARAIGLFLHREVSRARD